MPLPAGVEWTVWNRQCGMDSVEKKMPHAVTWYGVKRLVAVALVVWWTGLLWCHAACASGSASIGRGMASRRWCTPCRVYAWFSMPLFHVLCALYDMVVHSLEYCVCAVLCCSVLCCVHVCACMWACVCTGPPFEASDRPNRPLIFFT